MGKTPRPSKTTKKAPAPKAKAPAKPAPAPKAKAPAAGEKKPAGKDAKGAKPKAPAAASAPARKPGAAAGAPKPGATTGKKPAAAGAAPAKAPAPKAGAAEAPAPAPTAAGAEKKGGPKGITIVTPRPTKPSKPKPKFQMPVNEPLLRPGSKWKPLIPSGPSAPPRNDLQHAATDGPIKTKLSKKELDRYRGILLQKRAELVGDVRNMEDEALRQSSGSLSHTPQHMAEQGTDVFDQSLNLDLAQVDRNLIREIDAALERIENGTYGVCELTGKMISADRLEELPWARYSIEAARERERRSYTP